MRRQGDDGEQKIGQERVRESEGVDANEKKRIRKDEEGDKE